MFVLLGVAGRNAGLLLLILAGLAISSLAGAATALVMNLSAQSVRRAGNRVLAARLAGGPQLPPCDPGAAVHRRRAPSILMSQRNAFRALSLGEETAQSLGVDVGRLQAVR